MTISLEVPDWLKEKIKYWIDLLLMPEWDINASLALVLNDDPDTRGTAVGYPDINTGRISFRADIVDDEDWEITIVHELLHIKHSRIDDLISRVLEPQIQAPSELVVSLYRHQLEPYIDSLAKALVRINRHDREVLAMASVASAVASGVLGSDPPNVIRHDGQL